ncbi:MAG: response regulator [Bacteroidota bacterium]
MADDNQIQHYLINRLMDDLLPSWELVSFKEGKSLLLDLESRTLSEQPSKILLDLQMPHMDGFEFLDHFQERLAQQFKDTRIIILSSSLRYDDRTRAMAYPAVQSYLVKPIDRETFYQEITK